MRNCSLVIRYYVCFIIRNKTAFIYKKNSWISWRRWISSTSTFIIRKSSREKILVITSDFSPRCYGINYRRQFCEFDWPSSENRYIRGIIFVLSNESTYIYLVPWFRVFFLKSSWLFKDEIRKIKDRRKIVIKKNETRGVAKTIFKLTGISLFIIVIKNN